MIGIETTVNVFLHKEKNENLITTASYLPFKNENHIRAGGRALVDILRSIAHELTHNRQRELNLFNPGDEIQNIGGTIENEANSIAGILIKDFSHNHGYGHIYERKEISGKKIFEKGVGPYIDPKISGKNFVNSIIAPNSIGYGGVYKGGNGGGGTWGGLV